MRPLRSALAVFLLLASNGAAAAGLAADPTRPPTFSTSAPGAEKAAAERRLQSVLIAPGRSVAVIDGELVRVGSRLGDAQVVKIDESGVVLRGSGGTQTLRLLPDAARSVPRISRRNPNEERSK